VHVGMLEQLYFSEMLSLAMVLHLRSLGLEHLISESQNS